MVSSIRKQIADKARQEATALGRVRQDYDIEVVSPRSHAVRDMKTAVRNAIRLKAIFAHLLEKQGRLYLVKQGPAAWFLSRQDDIELVNRLEAMGLWADTVDKWHKGSLRGSIEDGLACLPSKTRQQIKEEAKWKP